MKRTILIGGARAQKLPSLVMEYSIRRRTKAELKILHSYDWVCPEPHTPALRSRTGFSFVRFMLPSLAEFEGIGLYTDSDMMVLDDIEKLFSIPFEDATVLRPTNLASVLLVDCAKARWLVSRVLEDLDRAKYTYERLMQSLCIEPPQNVRCAIPNGWNALDRYDERTTKLVHFTSMPSQPWVKEGHPFGWLWERELRHAIDACAISQSVVAEEIELGHIRKSIVQR